MQSSEWPVAALAPRCKVQKLARVRQEHKDVMNLTTGGGPAPGHWRFWSNAAIWLR
jgi:hypothetical protein